MAVDGPVEPQDQLPYCPLSQHGMLILNFVSNKKRRGRTMLSGPFASSDLPHRVCLHQMKFIILFVFFFKLTEVSQFVGKDAL